MYEKEQEKCIKVEDQLREQYRQHADTLKQLVEKQSELLNMQSKNQTLACEDKQVKKEDLIKDTNRKELDNLQHKVKNIESLVLEEVKVQREVVKALQDSVEAYKNEMTEKINNKCLKNITKEFNAREEIYEKRINKVVDKQFKDSEEVHRKEMQLFVESLVKEETRKHEYSKEANREGLYKLHLKVEEVEKEKIKKLEENGETHREELYKLQLKIEELEREKFKKLEENEETHREQLQKLQLKVELGTEKIQENEKTHREQHYKVQLKVEELECEKIKKIEENEESHRKELCKLQLKVEELETEKINKIEENEEAHREELFKLQLKVEELEKEKIKKIEENEGAHREEFYKLQLEVELETEKIKKIEETEEAHREELSKLQLKVEELERQKIKKIKENEEAHREDLCKLQLKVEELKGEKIKKIEENEEVHREEVNKLLLKVEELERQKIKKIEETEETCREELCKLQLKVEELEREKIKKVEENEEEHREKFNKLQLKVEELERKKNENEEAQREELSKLQLQVEKLERENIKKIEESEESHREELCKLQLSVEELEKEKIKKLEENNEAHREELNKLQFKVEELEREKEENEEAHREELYKLQLKVEGLEREKIKNIEKNEEEHRKKLQDLQVKVDTLKNETAKTFKDDKVHRKELYNPQLKMEEIMENEAKSLKDSEKVHRGEFYEVQLKVEELYKREATKFEDTKEAYRKEIHNLQVKLRKEVTETLEDSEKMHRKEFEMATCTNDDTNYKLEPMQHTKLNVKKHKKKGINNLITTDEETKEMLSISAKESSLSPDVLALMQMTGACQHSALSYDLQTATINIDCDDSTDKEKITEEFYTTYQELIMGSKLKQCTFQVDDIQQASVIVDECRKSFNHVYVRYNSEEKEIKCLSNDTQQMQNLQRWLNNIQKNASQSKVKSVHIELPKKCRKVTIKFGDITKEEVDIMVNTVSDHLTHGGGVAVSTDKVNYDEIQQESCKPFKQQMGALSTAEAVVTNAGGGLKCRFVVYTVEPNAYQDKDDFVHLLHDACVNSMLLARQFKAKSISFPPISSGTFGVSKELVANVMLSSLCSYTCSDAELLNDVRIVIIDKPTFDVFVKFVHQEKVNLELLQHCDTTSASIISQSNAQEGTLPHLDIQKCLSDLGSVDLCDRYIKPDNGKNEEVVSTCFIVVNKPCGYNSSNTDYTTPCIISASDNANLSLQSPSDQLNKPDQYEGAQCFSSSVEQQPAETAEYLKSSTKTQESKRMVCPGCFEDMKATDACKYCKQFFCKACLDDLLHCPICTVPIRKTTGNQPLGSTMVTTVKQQELPGYEGYGTIQINYRVPNENQSKEHHNPDKSFHGTAYTAYVPNSPEGRKVVRLLRKAFNARLIFTVKTSQTSSGTKGVVVWNDIPHKKKILGGPSKSVTIIATVHLLIITYIFTIVMATQTLHT